MSALDILSDDARLAHPEKDSTEFDVERYFRDAPLMIVGAGTDEIQRDVIAAQLVARGGLDG